MGEALRKLRTGGKEVVVDLRGPTLAVARSDRHAFAIHPASAGCQECRPEEGRRGICPAHYDPALVVPRCVRALIHAVVRGAHGDQLSRAEGKVYAAWLEALDAVDDGEVAPALTLDAVRWLQKCAQKEDAKVPLGMSQWREALVDYLDALVVRADDGAGSPPGP